MGFSIMSEGYRESQYTNAMSVSCNISLQEMNDEETEMILKVNEFASFISSSGYCLYINGREKVCSGSRILKNHMGFYRAAKQWNLSMELEESLEYIPQVKFWMNIFIGKYIFIRA